MAERSNVTVGDRIAMWRGLRGWTQRELADFAGLSPAFIGFLESGARDLNRRRDLNALAEALQCNPEDLTGEPFTPRDESGVLAYTAIPGLRAALLDGGPDLPPDVPARPLDALAHEVDWAQRKLADARYDSYGPRVPALVDELHVHAHTGPEDITRRALSLLVEVCYLAYGLARATGHPELALIAAEKGLQAARRVGDPALVGFIQWVQVLALERAGATRRAPKLAEAAVDAIEPHASGDPITAQVHGMLHLASGLLLARTENKPASDAHLDEAAAIARHTGESNDLYLHFGPTNVAMWRVGAAVELGDGPAALEVARSIDPQVIHGPAREADFYLELGRGLAQRPDGGQDREALRLFLRAEHLSPQKVRTDPLVRDVLAGMLRRDRSGSIDLRSLGKRIGVLAD